jgi:hypothetical protein
MSRGTLEAGIALVTFEQFRFVAQIIPAEFAQSDKSRQVRLSFEIVILS